MQGCNRPVATRYMFPVAVRRAGTKGTIQLACFARRCSDWLLHTRCKLHVSKGGTCSRLVTSAAGSQSLMVVESPAKAKKIQEYLGSDVKVIASYGHVRDVCTKSGSIRPEEWGDIKWVLVHSGRGPLDEISKIVKLSSKLILATDPDREGEAISWHIQEELKARGLLDTIHVERVTFNEITKSAVLEALDAPRQVRPQLVEAYLARRALDFQMGFTLSPILWRKLPGLRSAGRVQSVALRLVCDRELEVARFKPQEYWTVGVELDSSSGKFNANLTHVRGKKLQKLSIGNEVEAHDAAEIAKASSLAVKRIVVKETRRKPQPPFTTSTLQQEALNKLGFEPSKTDRIAQSLYTGEKINGEGLITYIRTDSVSMSSQAIRDIRSIIASMLSSEYVPKSIRNYKSKSKNAQEAHEAIRPTNPSVHPSAISNGSADQKRLYELIWNRAVASQMSDARVSQISLDVSDPHDKVVLHSSDSRVVFDGFLGVYRPSTEEERAAWRIGHGSVLSVLTEGQPISVSAVTPSQHLTVPPFRYTEATLVKSLEERGIGRPSTYATTLKVLKVHKTNMINVKNLGSCLYCKMLEGIGMEQRTFRGTIFLLVQDREYMERKGRALHATGKGQVLSAFLLSYFSQYVDYDFTSKMEAQLDSIARGEEMWTDTLDAFWEPFYQRVSEVSKTESTSSVVDAVDKVLSDAFFPPREDGSDPRKCPLCEDGYLCFKPAKATGGFIGCTNYKEKGCTFSAPLETLDLTAVPANEEGSLGIDPRTSGRIYLQNGRFGPYLQLVPCDGSKYKLKNVSIPKALAKTPITLEKAIELLRPIREVGFHPDDGDVIEVRSGRFSPYLRHGKTVAKLPKDVDIAGISMETALDLLKAAGKKTRSKKGTKKQTQKSKPRVKSAYLEFCSVRRAELRKERPGTTPTEVMKLLGKEWRQLGDKEKQTYQDSVEENKERKLETSKPKIVDSKKKKGKKKTAEAKKPSVKVANGYVTFGSLHRPLLKKINPSITFGESSKKLGQLWKTLDDSEKDHYKKVGAQELSLDEAKILPL